MSALEQKLEDALRRIEELEAAVGRTGALSGWEQLRPFFTGKTKLDGTGLQVIAAAADSAAITFVQSFQANPSEHPPSAPAFRIWAEAFGAGTVLSRSVNAADLADFLLASPKTKPYVYETTGSTTGSFAQTIRQAVYPGSTAPGGDNATFSLYVDEDNARASLVAQQVALYGSVVLGIPLTPTALAADTNNYAPTGIGNASVLRLSSDASRNLTGIAPGIVPDGRLLPVYNIGAQNIVLVNASASSDEANRFAIGADITIGPDEGVTLLYDATSTRWRCIGKHV